MAEIMALNSVSPGGSVLHCEIRKRVWWSLYMIDMWCISGQGLNSQMKDVEVKIELPMDDTTFSVMRSDQSVAKHTRKRGMWAELTLLVPIFRPIHKLNRVIAENGSHESDIESQVDQLAQKLEGWRT